MGYARSITPIARENIPLKSLRIHLPEFNARNEWIIVTTPLITKIHPRIASIAIEAASGSVIATDPRTIIITPDTKNHFLASFVASDILTPF
jgi:hypothetical protein